MFIDIFRHFITFYYIFEMHCPMCCPARDGLRSKVRLLYFYT